MQFIGKIQNFPKEIKVLISLFLLILSIGFLSALQFVEVSTEASPKGIQENYLGNEDDLEAEELKFAKSEKQILNIIHSHMLSMSLIFLTLAVLVSTTPLKGFFRKLLLFEPLVSVVLTFGGIYFLWKGLLWMKYIVMLSGLLMTISFVASVLVIWYWALKKKV